MDGLEVNNLLSLTGNKDGVPYPHLMLQVINERIRLLQEAKIPLHVQDARDYHALSHILTHIKPQVIVHLAAVSHANRSNKNPYMTFDHSFRTLENALDWARHGAEHFIFLSSSMVYGNFKTSAVTEDMPCEPLGIYGALKFGAERKSSSPTIKCSSCLIRSSAPPHSAWRTLCEPLRRANFHRECIDGAAYQDEQWGGRGSRLHIYRGPRGWHHKNNRE